jgi:hypothetical protein
MSQDEQATPPIGAAPPEGDPAAGEEQEHDDPAHRGDFAEGTAKTHVTPGTLMGDFAAGQEHTPRTGTVQPKGDFATGEHHEPGDPAALRGDFARGQEKTPRK